MTVEPYVKLLYDRLEQPKQLELYAVMQNAINELHNSGIIAGLPPELQKKAHDPDPEVRVREKTAMAKAVGKSSVLRASPVPENGRLCYHTVVRPDPRFFHSLCLCLQGGIEGLYQAGIHKQCGGKMRYYVTVEPAPGVDTGDFEKLLQQLNGWYGEYEVTPGTPGQAEKPPIPPKPPVTPANTGKEKKPGLFAGLFGKKKEEPKPSKPHELFFGEMYSKPGFRQVFAKAEQEILTVLEKRHFTLKAPNGAALDSAGWKAMPQTQRMEYILSLGNYGITPSALLCVDFGELIPNCLALTLLFSAHTGQQVKQLLDTGDGCDSSRLQNAILELQPCCPNWICRILA